MSSDFQTLIGEAQSLAAHRPTSRRRLAAKIASMLPEGRRFSTCGLPGGLAEKGAWKSEPVANPPGFEGGGFIARIEGGIASDMGAHFTHDGRIIPELSTLSNGRIMERCLTHLTMFPVVERRAGPLISLAIDGHKSFSRWMYGVLPRWHFIKTARLDQSGGVYACMQSRYHRESLNLLGLVPARVIDSAAHPFYGADVLCVPSFVRDDEPWITQWLRDSLLAPALKHSSLHTRKRIYISRKNAGTRRVANEAELLVLLKKHEFTEICLEDYSLSGQIALFHAAQAVVAPHGAGLTHLTFSEPGAFALELIAEGLNEPLYERIAQTRGLRYQPVRCAPVNPSDCADSDIQVNLDAVSSALARI